MKKFLTVTAIAAVAGLALAGCAGPRDAGDTAEEGSGFEQESLIGVALPSKTSENWVLAGDLFVNGLEEAGFEADVQYAGATNPVKDQQDQISAMITNGAKVIVVGAADGGQLNTQVQAAADSGAVVIAYDRLILNTENVDYYVAYDNFEVGELQGQALLEGMKAKKPEGPWNIELFSGSSDDANSAVFFDGAMSVLEPMIESGDLNVVSGQTDIKQTATAGWEAENAQSRMETLLTGFYGTEELDGVLSPNDTLARAIITAAEQAGKPIPTVTGQDSEVESVKSIMADKQYSTINKDTRALVAEAIEMVQSLQAGDDVTVNDEESYDNGVKVVPANLLPPEIVTKENAAESYADDDTLGPLTQ